MPPHVVWVGRVVIGRKSDQTFHSALLVVEPHFWGKTDPPSLAPPPGRAGRPVGPRLCRCRLFVAGLSIRPRTSSLLFLGLPGQTLASNPVGSSQLFGELWWARGKTACRPSSFQPHSVYSMDEKGFHLGVHSRTKVIVRYRRFPQVENVPWLVYGS